VKERLS